MEFSLKRVGILFFRIITLLLIVGAFAYQAVITVSVFPRATGGQDDWGLGEGVLTFSIIAWTIDFVIIYAFLMAKQKDSSFYWLSLFIFAIFLCFSQFLLIGIGLMG